tara:strand:+ start:2045 stop:2272 length:228 start_codon:yes stop_codon:yes gene_type:complete
MVLLRDEIALNIHEINIEIQALERIIAFYVAYEEKHGEWEYTSERIQLLNSRYAEFLIAGQIARDGVESPRVIGN